MRPSTPMSGWRRWLSPLRFREAVGAYVCVAPFLLGLLLFSGGPILASAGLSFTDYPVLQPPRWAGLDNYRIMFFEDPEYWQSLKVTSIYTGGAVPLYVIMGYALALLLNQKVKGLSFWRTVFYLPSVVPAIATAYLFAYLFNSDLGLVNGVLAQLGITGPKWFGSTTWALPTLMIMSTWGAGSSLVLYLAALQGVPSVLYDASHVDGANAWQRFWNVTLPMTSPVVLFTFLTGIIGSFQAFTGAYIITQGGPANATLFYVLHLYRNAWNYLKMGYGAAMAWVLFMIIFGLTLLTLRVSGRLVYYAGRAR